MLHSLSHLFRRRAPRGHTVPPSLFDSLAAASMPMGVFLTDIKGNCIHVNDPWCRLTGLGRKQAMGQGWVLAVHPEDRAEFFSAWTKGVDRRCDFSLEFRVRRSIDDCLWVRLAAAPMTDERGAVTGFVGTVTDVSDQRRTEQRLRDSESRLKAIFDTVLEGIITIDADGIIRSFNSAATRIFGWAADEAVGRPVAMLMPEPCRSQHQIFVANSAAGAPPRILGVGRDVTGQRKDGSTFPLNISVCEFRCGSEPMFVGLARDISDRKEIDCMKDEFITVVSHELRTPVTSINGALSLLHNGAAGELPEQAQKLIDIAYQSNLRLVEQLGDILDMECLWADRVVFRDDRLDLAELVERAADASRFSSSGVPIQFLEGVRPGQAFIRGDAGRVLQVIGKLLSNAIKHSPSGEVVEIDLIRRGAWWRVAVTDHGRGVPRDFRARVFQRFAHCDELGTRAKGGLGLGLAIAKAVVGRLGGHIGFDSEHGRGTTFWFELPANEERRELRKPEESGSVAMRPMRRRRDDGCGGLEAGVEFNAGI